MRVLITGGSGLLGKYLKRFYPEAATTWFANPCGCDYQMDICVKSQVDYVFDCVKPEVVIHCAGAGNVDYAEGNWEAVSHINRGGTQNILRAAMKYKAKFVYISSNAVYGGHNPPYSELSPQRPVNAYGMIKSLTEDDIKVYDNWLVIRPFLLYGWHYKNARANWVTTLLGMLKDGKDIKMVDDVYWQPTHAADMAGAIHTLIAKSEKCRSYNVATSDRITLYQFALTVAKVWGYGTEKITPVSSAYFKTIAPRPKDTTYDLSKIKAMGIELDSVEIGLEKMKNEG